MVVQQDVSAGLQLVLMISLGAGSSLVFVVRVSLLWSGVSCFVSSQSLCALRALPVLF